MIESARNYEELVERSADNNIIEATDSYASKIIPPNIPSSLYCEVRLTKCPCEARGHVPHYQRQGYLPLPLFI